MVNRNKIGAIAIAAAMSLVATGCSSTNPPTKEQDPSGARFLQLTPAEVSTAFVRDGEIWMVLSKSAEGLVRVGDGTREIKFVTRGNYYVVPDQHIRLYMQFGNGKVEIMEPRF